jgi:hypothetical protein
VTFKGYQGKKVSRDVLRPFLSSQIDCADPSEVLLSSWEAEGEKKCICSALDDLPFLQAHGDSSLGRWLPQ